MSARKLAKLKRRLERIQAKIAKHERKHRRHSFGVLPQVRSIRAQLSGRFEEVC